MAQVAEIGFYLGSGGGQERPKDRPFRAVQFWMNARQPFSPRTAQEFGEDRFSLIIEGVSGGDGVHCALRHKLMEPAIAETAGRFLDGFRGFGRITGLGRCRTCLGFGGGIDVRLMEGQAKGGGEVAAKGQVRIGLRAAQAVVEVSYMQYQAQLCAALGQGAQESYRIRAPGKGYGEAEARFEQGCVDWKVGAH